MTCLSAVRAFAPVAAGCLCLAASVDAAAAEPSTHAEAVWTWFTEHCPRVVAAADPVNTAATIDGVSGTVVQSLDGQVRHASLQITDASLHADVVLLFVSLNGFDEGRTVQCMLQLVNALDPLTGLTDLASGDAARLFDAETALETAGGPVVGFAIGDGGPVDQDGAGTVRISTAGFPPEAVLTVQNLDQLVMLSLHRLQPSEGP